MPRRALKLVFEWMDLHIEELMQNWQAAQTQRQIKKIDPWKQISDVKKVKKTQFVKNHLIEFTFNDGYTAINCNPRN